jgi:hypothetical protein
MSSLNDAMGLTSDIRVMVSRYPIERAERRACSRAVVQSLEEVPNVVEVTDGAKPFMLAVGLNETGAYARRMPVTVTNMAMRLVLASRLGPRRSAATHRG